MKKITLSKEVIIIYENILSKLSNLELQIPQIRQTLAHLPDGSLICAHNGSYFKWYHSISGKQIYLSKQQLYVSHKIIPSIRLITTYETLDYPLNTPVAESIIQHYFL